MKTAVNKDGDIIEACETAPKTAACPHCGGAVTLRGRRTMDGEVTFFWRHKQGSPHPCPKRSSPVGRRKNAGRRS